MNYTKKELKLFNKVFDLKYEVDAIATMRLTKTGVAECKALEHHNYVEQFAYIALPGIGDFEIPAHLCCDAHDICIKAFDAYLAKKDWNDALEVLQPFID